MKIDLNAEVITFLYAVLCGGACGICFDFFRAVRKKVKAGAAVTGVTDMLFWICTSVVVGYFSFYVNQGMVRAFVLCGLILGVVLYFLLISKAVFWLFLKIIEIICKIINLFFKILLTPLQFSYKIIVGIKNKK